MYTIHFIIRQLEEGGGWLVYRIEQDPRPARNLVSNSIGSGSIQKYTQKKIIFGKGGHGPPRGAQPPWGGGAPL